MLNILSLGAGVQSSALLLMSCNGILPRLDAAIFADTQWESADVYLQLEFLKDRASYAGIPVHIVTAGNLRADALNFRETRESSEGRWASMPLFVKNPDGTRGIINRQCTSEYKIEPIEKFIKRDLLGIPKGARVKECLVDQWFGISIDEKRRIRLAKERWKRNVYPLCSWPIPMLTRPWARHDCLAWLTSNYPEIQWTGSACLGCPFRRDDDWRDMKETRPDEFADAVDFDLAIRDAERKNQTVNSLLVGEPYLHDSLVPLGKIDFRNAEDKGQRNWINECLGMCGI